MRVQPCWWSVADEDEKGLVPVKTVKLLFEHFVDCSFIRREIKNKCKIESQSLVNVCVSCKCNIIVPGCFNSEHQRNTGRLRWLLKSAQISPDTGFHSAAADSGHLQSNIQSNIRWIKTLFRLLSSLMFPWWKAKSCFLYLQVKNWWKFLCNFWQNILLIFHVVPPSLVTDKITGKARLIGNQSKWRWQHYSVVITLCNQYPPHNEERESKQARDFLSAV